MEYLKVHDWNEWQTYRNDRGMPPWIKIHRCLMRDVKWVSLSCQQRGQLIAIWLLAADHDGVIPDDAALVRKLCYMDEDPDLNAFVSMGLLDRDAKVAPTRRQGGANVTPTRRQRDALETETERETEKKNTRSRETKKTRDRGTDIPFLDFWALYPRKVKKADAEKAWRNLTKTEQRAALADVGNGRFAATQKQYTPHPTTYLHGKQWQDEHKDNDSDNGKDADQSAYDAIFERGI